MLGPSAAASVASLFILNSAARAADNEDAGMNVVVLVSDDHRWDGLGVAGNEEIHTPHLDRMANEGVRFSNAYVTTSICMTSRASILTGQYMSLHGIDRFGKQLSNEAFAKTYPALLRKAGYWTGFVGKYGVGSIRNDDFDFARAYEGVHWYDDPNEPGGRIHVTERNARDSLDFLRERPQDRPFCLSVSYFAPHAEDRHEKQYLPQEWSAEYYEDGTIPLTWMVPLVDETALERLPWFLSQDSNEGRVRYGWRFNTEEQYQRKMTDYFRLITEVDEAVGRLIDELKEQGVYENTLIFFMGDNGYFYGERGLAGKWYPYEESIRVPLLVHDPRLPESERGVVRDEMVLNIDLAPAIVAAAGLPSPGVMQGKDLARLYLGDTPPAWREEFFYEHPTITNKDRIPTSEAVVRLDVKYAQWPEFEHEQLFDLTEDPYEIENLADDPEYAALLDEMRGKLAEWRKTAASPLGKGNRSHDGLVIERQ